MYITTSWFLLVEKKKDRLEFMFCPSISKVHVPKNVPAMTVSTINLFDNTHKTQGEGSFSLTNTTNKITHEVRINLKYKSQSDGFK